MDSAITRLLKVLDLERKQGYRNKAVIGGLDKFASRWEADARAETGNAAVIGEIVSLLLGYAVVEERAARERILDLIVRRAQSLESGGAEGGEHEQKAPAAGQPPGAKPAALSEPTAIPERPKERGGPQERAPYQERSLAAERGGAQEHGDQERAEALVPKTSKPVSQAPAEARPAPVRPAEAAPQPRPEPAPVPPPAAVEAPRPEQPEPHRGAAGRSCTEKPTTRRVTSPGKRSVRNPRRRRDARGLALTRR